MPLLEISKNGRYYGVVYSLGLVLLRVFDR